MPDPNKQFSFLEVFILNILKDNGFENLSEENQKTFLPQLTTEAEYRIGLAVIPKLNKENAEKFATMMDKGDATPEEWQTFWTQAVPDFDELVNNTLIDFGRECRDILVAQN